MLKMMESRNNFSLLQNLPEVLDLTVDDYEERAEKVAARVKDLSQKELLLYPSDDFKVVQKLKSFEFKILSLYCVMYSVCTETTCDFNSCQSSRCLSRSERHRKLFHPRSKPLTFFSLVIDISLIFISEMKCWIRISNCGAEVSFKSSRAFFH